MKTKGRAGAPRLPSKLARSAAKKEAPAAEKAGNARRAFSNAPLLPARGIAPQKLRALLHAAKDADAKWQTGRTWSLVYYAGKEHTERLLDVYRMFYSENALSPTAFPSLARFEKEIVRIMATLLRGGETACGTMTSGGTESILLAAKTHRDRFRKQHPRLRRVPQIIIPASAHPAFYKAAQYFDLEPITVPLRADHRLAPEDVAAAITKHTALLVASAPSFPFGMIDPIAELGQLAKERDLGLHVDACLGGAFLPFMRKLGRPVPPFDFSVPGVTSISADLHKYGFAMKGTSVVLYRDAALRRFQFFVKPDWLGGAFASPAMLGTRPGGGIASAWAALMLLGEEGYTRLVQRTLRFRDQLVAGIRAVKGLEIVGEPDMSVLCFTSRTYDIFAIADALEKCGWRIDRQNNPPSIHMIVTVNHRKAVGDFLRDLRRVTPTARRLTPGDTERQSAALYGVTNCLVSASDPIEALYQAMEANYV